MNKKKTRHEGNEGTVAFWLYMKVLYKDQRSNRMARENYAYWYIQDIIDREIKKAFKLRE